VTEKHHSAKAAPGGVVVTLGREPAQVFLTRKEGLALVAEITAALAIKRQRYAAKCYAKAAQEREAGRLMTAAWLQRLAADWSRYARREMGIED
jgi:hypothetical protein